MFQESELIDSKSKKHKHRARQLGLASEEKAGWHHVRAN